MTIPEMVRWQFKLEPSQVLKVTLSVEGSVGARQVFFAKMRKDGCITVPPLPEALLKQNELSLEGCPMEVMLEPT